MARRRQVFIGHLLGRRLVGRRRAVPEHFEVLLNSAQTVSENRFISAKHQERDECRKYPKLRGTGHLGFRLPTEQIAGNLECHQKPNRKRNQRLSHVRESGEVSRGVLQTRGEIRGGNEEGNMLNPRREAGEWKR